MTNGCSESAVVGSDALTMLLIECVPSAAIVLLKLIVYHAEFPAASLTQARTVCVPAPSGYSGIAAGLMRLPSRYIWK